MRWLALALAPMLLTACGDDSQQRLNEALSKEGIKDVKVTDTKVTAICASGSTSDVDASELEKNFLGMVRSDRLGVVANKLNKQCEDADLAKRKVDASKMQIADAAKTLKLNVVGLSDDDAKKAVCDALTAALPIKDADRVAEDAKNQNRYGCPAAPPVGDLPTGAWQIETAPPQGKKPVPTYARLANDDGERLTARCQSKKADIYLQLNDPVKKGTKTVDVKIPGAAKPAKWKVKPSTDGKALFFTDVKPVFKAMANAEAVSINIPENKKLDTAVFKIKGFGEALKKFPKECQ